MPTRSRYREYAVKTAKNLPFCLLISVEKTFALQTAIPRYLTLAHHCIVTSEMVKIAVNRVITTNTANLEIYYTE